eukprot:gnl/MRDRNA2_/MRDRNA2_27501_c0_seq1.p1 gnl/MRDRNA2_/MRDRNA2_27501_c0~~gnl/MRDRNA2_/MRDRNA2_27501_c0_seq1.p1  ORF type:complete len:648 (+),score=128.11 gnl/MRDRNA2_/MRDRNA2_27501_c0_seq1:58-2001(+)
MEMDATLAYDDALVFESFVAGSPVQQRSRRLADDDPHPVLHNGGDATLAYDDATQAYEKEMGQTLFYDQRRTSERAGNKMGHDQPTLLYDTVVEEAPLTDRRVALGVVLSPNTRSRSPSLQRKNAVAEYDQVTLAYDTAVEVAVSPSKSPLFARKYAAVEYDDATLAYNTAAELALSPGEMEPHARFDQRNDDQATLMYDTAMDAAPSCKVMTNVYKQENENQVDPDAPTLAYDPLPAADPNMDLCNAETQMYDVNGGPAMHELSATLAYAEDSTQHYPELAPVVHDTKCDARIKPDVPKFGDVAAVPAKKVALQDAMDDDLLKALASDPSGDTARDVGTAIVSAGPSELMRLSDTQAGTLVYDTLPAPHAPNEVHKVVASNATFASSDQHISLDPPGSMFSACLEACMEDTLPWDPSEIPPRPPSPKTSPLQGSAAIWLTKKQHTSQSNPATDQQTRRASVGIAKPSQVKRTVGKRWRLYSKQACPWLTSELAGSVTTAPLDLNCGVAASSQASSSSAGTACLPRRAFDDRAGGLTSATHGKGKVVPAKDAVITVDDSHPRRTKRANAAAPATAVGQKLRVAGDGWGGGKGFYHAIVTEADDEQTYTVVMEGSKSTRVVLRENCTLPEQSTGVSQPKSNLKRRRSS